MIRFEYLSLWQVLLGFAALAVPIVLLGRRSLVALGPRRKWLAIGTRLALVLAILLVLAGARIERENKDVEVMVLRDVSRSTQLVAVARGTLNAAIDETLRKLVESDREKKPADRIGIVSFDRDATVDAAPAPALVLDARATRDRSGNATDVGNAIQLALATMGRDAMNRIVLIWDGNQTLGDLDAAVRQAASKGIPIDVMPLLYQVKNEVKVERFVSPTWRKENEPFTIDVVLQSTNPGPVSGQLRVRHQGQDLDLDPTGPGVTRAVTLQPGANVEHVQVPALTSGGVHDFEAIFETPSVTSTVAGQRTTSTPGDTIRENNAASTFTFVRGKGQVLYVDQVPDGGGKFLRDALVARGINIDLQRTSVDQFPTSLIELQNYDAVILANVPRGSGGLSDQQQAMLVGYVRDTGGGLVMIGGDQAFGAGGWQGSDLEKILPVNMDVPAQRKIPKGALAVLIHSCEFANGNYWGEQCAIKAAEVLSPRDEIGVLSFQWQGPGAGTGWDFPLSERGDGTKVTAAIKNMQVGDMPDFNEAMIVALNGGKPGEPGLINSDAAQKHLIIISDGDPQPPSAATIQAYNDAKVSVSTVSVFPHELPIPKTMADIAAKTGGRAYGPIESNPSQLPQIFVKEATVVRRSLLNESKEGFEVKATADTGGALDLLRGLPDAYPRVFGDVITSRKDSPLIEMPLVVGDNNDPLLASWQVGLGRAAVFTSDAYNRWAAQWVGADFYDKFWSQIVKGVSKPAESADFETNVKVEGDRGKITVEAVGNNSDFRNFLRIEGSVVGPDAKPIPVRLQQVRPGVYEADFPAGDAGNYVVGLAYQDSKGQNGVMRSGTVVNASPELRSLQSDLSALRNVAIQTGGRELDLFSPGATSLFTRTGLRPTRSPLPLWDILLPLLIALLLIDIAVRRIAWDSLAVKQWLAVQRSRFATPGASVETTATIDALRGIRAGDRAAPKKAEPPPRDPSRKFEAREQTKGNLTDLVGGATNQPTQKQSQPANRPAGDQPASGGGMSGLLDAKRKAQEEIRRREEGQK